MKSILALISAATLAAGCAAHTLAARGASVDDLARCKTEACILGYGPVVLKVYPARYEGDREVLYRVQRASGPGAQLITGMRDRSAPGAFEAVGEPIEGFASSKEEIVFKVSYQPGGHVIQVSVQN